MKIKFMPVIFLLFSGAYTMIHAVEVNRVEEKKFQFSPGGTISLFGNDGSITITTWEKDEVYLKMTRRAWARSKRDAEQMLDALDVSIQRGIKRLVIREVKRNRHFNFFDLFDPDFWESREWRNGLIDYELKVPGEVNLKIRNDEGDVDIKGIKGRLNVKIDEGDLYLEQIASESVEIDMDEGDISMNKLNGTGSTIVRINVDEGRVLVEDGSSGELDIKTDEGDMSVRRFKASRLWLSSDEGTISAEFDSDANGNYHFETDEGDIELWTNENSSLRVRLVTDEGVIESDFDLEERKTDDGEIAYGEIGKGEALLRAYTDEGDIFLKIKEHFKSD